MPERLGVWLKAALAAGVLCPVLQVHAATQQPVRTEAQIMHHRAHRALKKPLPPLPSGPRGPVPQIPLDALPAVAPEVHFQNGLLTITAANSTLGDILRAVRNQTAAEIDVPGNANERVAVHLGPAPPREVVAELLNGSHFNYILLGSPENASTLMRVVLVAKTGPDNPEPNAQANAASAPETAKPADDADAADNTVDESVDQAATEADETPPDEPGVKTPQQMLQEMQQRQLQMQQQQQNNGQAPSYPPPGGVMPQRAPIPPQQPQDE
ncbi:MAG TPA: hypothetical protein VMF10_15725 [Candidatus Aquilonibacter sp.]|nr:hypothetical protein [Candidatus Aquilonibacter sp.]